MKGPCPHCGKEYTERSGASYRHFDRQTGKVSWCRSKSVERRIKYERESGVCQCKGPENASGFCERCEKEKPCR